jgi:endonuclease YncB( thermonuclease family)
MGQSYIFSKKQQRRAQLWRRLRDLVLLAAAVAVLLQPEVREHIGSTALAFAESAGAGAGAGMIRCTALTVIDGDTLDCAGERIRLVGIDAPEMPGHCRAGRRCVDGDPHAAKSALQAFAASGLSCAPDGQDSYGRTLARCQADGRDASCALIASGHAEARYGRISCAGRA